MSKAVVIRQPGGTEVLTIEDVEAGDPGPGQLRIRHKAIGLNFVDVYQRTGAYNNPFPMIGGNEGAGVVTAVGPDVDDWAIGDRVAYTGVVGAYAEERLLAADRAIPVPEGISDEVAAAALLKGTTAYYLLHLTHPLKAGEATLVHAAAGGTGSILVQWAKAIGATVAATAGGPEKCALVRRLGADLVVDYRSEDFVAPTRELTGGRGVDVVYDGVGKATFERSLDCLRPRGLMVSFGNASGPVSIDNLMVLARKGSLYLTRPTSAGYFVTGDDVRKAAAALFAVIGSGRVKVAIDQRFPLSEIAAAHAALEARRTTGSTVILP
jgi:NADPH2:quinone reductase